MRKICFIVTAMLVSGLGLAAQSYDTLFEDATLRLDYVFCGDNARQEVYFQQAYRTSKWAGRRHNLGECLLRGNGQIILRRLGDGSVAYINGFSTLFQEWQVTDEASKVQRAFENCFQVPFPKEKMEVELRLYDNFGRVSCSMKHVIDPADILICKKQDNGFPSRVIRKEGKLSEAIDVVIVSDGYAAEDYVKFFADAERACTALMGHKPFSDYPDRFTFRAVFAQSLQSGVSVPHEGRWRETSLDSHFDTFYTQRYLTTSSMQKVYDAIGTVPFEHIIVLVNTPVYGGGGIFNSVTIMGSDHPTFRNVLVHEFGHAFGGLADEYFYAGDESEQYPLSVEPWEPNISTLVDFDAKWKDMLPDGIAIPTPVDEIEKQDVRRIWNTLSAEQKASLNLKTGVYEGAGYRTKGIYRPVQECRMRMNECEEFCPVCSRAIVRMIEYYSR